ncbi:hypothetical protein ABEV74_10410 [Paenibacillus cisolokensis]|uniref:hypothetical protein n=1 Tax=Paenibacillus cisolokensis TaxID=1658519 RepID=UPI003D282D50
MTVYKRKTDFGRENVRLRLTDTKLADLTIREVKGQPVTAKCCKVLIHKIAPDGLSFLTYLRFPVSRDYKLQICLSLSGQPIQAGGQVISRKKQENLYLYDLLFVDLSSSKLALVRLLNETLIRQSPRQARIHQMYRRMSR